MKHYYSLLLTIASLCCVNLSYSRVLPHKAVASSPQHVSKHIEIATFEKGDHCVSYLYHVDKRAKRVVYKIYCDDGSDITDLGSYKRSGKSLQIYEIYNASADSYLYVIYDVSTDKGYLSQTSSMEATLLKSSINLSEPSLSVKMRGTNRVVKIKLKRVF